MAEETMADLLAKIPHRGDVTYSGGYRIENEGSYVDACALCGHDPACGDASVTSGDMTRRLCHADDHSCYHRWTVYGDRPVPG